MVTDMSVGGAGTAEQEHNHREQTRGQKSQLFPSHDHGFTLIRLGRSG
jgi:hypothetical protein